MSETMQAEMLEKLQNARSAEEIIAVAKEYDLEVTAEQAQELLDRLKVGGGLGWRTVRRFAGGCRWRAYHRCCRVLVEPPLALMIRKAAPTEPFGIRLGRRALALRAADAGRGHMVRVLGFAAR